LNWHSTIAKLKTYDLDLDEYLFKEDFKKDALSIIGSQKAYKKVGDEIFKKSERRLPGVSPIAALIKGHNPAL
jgi:hypothetical protein